MHWGSDFFLMDMHTCKWIILAIFDQMANGFGSIVVPQLPFHGWEVISTERYTQNMCIGNPIFAKNFACHTLACPIYSVLIDPGRVF